MNPDSSSVVRSPAQRSARWVKCVLCGIVLVAVVFAGYLIFRTPQAEVPGTGILATTKADAPTVRVKREQTPPAPREVAAWDDRTSPPLPRKARAHQRSNSLEKGSLVRAQELLAKLSQLDFDDAITPEQAKELNQLLQLLESQGKAALPALREFLQSEDDINFDLYKGGDQVDYASLRIAVLDMVLQLGGPEAVEISLETLQTTTDPLEIALIGRALEEMAPNQYRKEALTAARYALSLASGTRLGGRDITPLFEFWQQYGDESIVPDLEGAAARWNYYATMALAGLPNGAGVPSLIQLAKDPKILTLGKGDYALRMLAEVALQYPEAGIALLGQARDGQIPDGAWPSIGSALQGYSLQYGNRIFGTAPPTTWSNNQIDKRVAFIDQMLAATSNPTAIQTLQNAKTTLLAKLTK